MTTLKTHNDKSKKQREEKQESKIIILIIIAYIISYYVHSQIIPYLHIMFFPFLFGVQLFNYIKSGMIFYIFDFPIFIHLIISIYLLLFKDNVYLFSLSWILSIGYSSFSIILLKRIIFLQFDYFFEFYLNYSPLLIIYIISNDIKITYSLMPYFGLISASFYFIIWSIINILLIRLFKKKNINNINNIPFIKISKTYTKIFCPLYLKNINIETKFYNIYVNFIIINLFYLWIVGGISIFLFKFKWICFFYIIGLFIFGSIQGFRLFLINLDKEINAQNIKKKS